MLSAWTGIRPLVKDPAAGSTENLSRDHIVHVGDRGVITVAGGKWTTYREMAEDAVDACVKEGKLEHAKVGRGCAPALPHAAADVQRRRSGARPRRCR